MTHQERANNDLHRTTQRHHDSTDQASHQPRPTTKYETAHTHASRSDGPANYHKPNTWC
jgi:hypothetical protein